MEDTKIKENICNYIREGMFKKDSAIMAGISEATFYRWIEEDESFESLVEASVMEYKRTLIKNITNCAEKDGRLALEVLKRRYPKEWGDNATTLTNSQDLSKERKNVAELLEKIYRQNDDTNETVLPSLPNGQS